MKRKFGNSEKEMIKELDRLAKSIRDVAFYGSPNYDPFLAKLLRYTSIRELRKFVDESRYSLEGVREASEIDYAVVKKDVQVIDRLIHEGVKPTAFTLRCALYGSVMLEDLKEKLRDEKELLVDVKGMSLDEYENYLRRLTNNSCIKVKSVI